MTYMKKIFNCITCDGNFDFDYEADDHIMLNNSHRVREIFVWNGT